MDVLKGPTVELAKLALVSPTEFDPKSKEVTGRLQDVHACVKHLRTSNPAAFTLSLADQVYLPLHYLLQKDSLGDLQTEQLLLILAELFAGPWRSSLVLSKAQQFVAVITYLISPDPPGITVKFRENPAFLKSAGFICLRNLFVAITDSGISPEIGKSPSLANNVALLLEGIEFGGEHDTVFSAIEALDVLLSKVIVLPDRNALVLPGVISRLVNLGVEKFGRTHFDIKVAATRVMDHLLTTCLNDNIEPAESRIRTAPWKTATAHQINQSFSVLFQQVSRARNPQVRSAIFLLVVDLCDQCLETLKVCIETFADVLLFCATQLDDPELVKSAKSALIRLSERSLFSLGLESRVLNLLESLPNRFSSADETSAIVALRGIAAGLQVIRSQALLKTSVEMISDSLQFQQKARTLAQEKTVAIDSKRQISEQLARTYAADSTEKVKVSSLGIDMGVSNAVEPYIWGLLEDIGSVMTTESFQEVISSLDLESDSSSLSQTQSLWTVACLSQGQRRSGTFSKDDVGDILDLTFSVIDRTGALDNANPSLTALSLLSVGEISAVYGHEFRELLPDILNPVISHLGSNYGMIIEQAKVALQKVSLASGYDSVKDMVLDNRDYIVDGISQKLDTLDFSPATPQVLSILIMLSDGSLVPYMKDLMNSLFVILDNYHGYSVLVAGIFGVFRSAVASLTRKYSQALTIENKPGIKRFNPIVTFEDLLEVLNTEPEVAPELLEATESATLENLEAELRNRDQPESDSPDEDVDDIDAPMPDADTWNSVVPENAYGIVERIYSYSDRFLTHKSPQIRYNLLELVGAALPLLAANDKTFLPQVHLMWPTLVEQLFDSEIYVSEAAYGCASDMCRLATDFMSSRIGELWQRMRRQSLDKFDMRRQYPERSVEARTLAAVSRFLAKALAFVPLDPAIVDEIIIAFSPALSTKAVPELHEALSLVVPDQLWYYTFTDGGNLHAPGSRFYPFEQRSAI